VKRCPQCTLLKKNSKFSPDKKQLTKLRSWCKLCMAARSVAIRAKRKTWVFSMTGQTCLGCGEDFPQYVFEFHHRVPNEKVFAIASGYSRSKKIILAELEKCDLLCANCHKHAHHLMEREEENEKATTMAAAVQPTKLCTAESVQLQLRI